MDYKRLIIEMIKSIDNENLLEIIYDFVVVPYSKSMLEREQKIKAGED